MNEIKEELKKLKVEIEDIPSQNKTDVGGILFIPFYVEQSLAEDKKITNIAKFNYILNNIASESYLTNEVVFFRNYTPLLVQEGKQVQNLFAIGDKYIFEITSRVTNNGNGADTFNVLIKNSNFPSEVILSNLSDTNGDGILDTGLLNIGETREITIRGVIDKDKINNSYSLNLLFNSLKAQGYSMSIGNFFNLNVESSNIRFLKEQRTENTKYVFKIMQKLNTSHYKTFAAFSLMLIISSCSNTKFLQEGQMLYTGAKITVKNDTLSKKDKSNLKEALQEQLRPKPNSSFLGLQQRLYVYNITKEPKKQKELDTG